MNQVKMTIDGQDFPAEVGALFSAVFTGETLDADGVPMKLQGKQRGDYILKLQNNTAFTAWVNSLSGKYADIFIHDENDEGADRDKTYHGKVQDLIQFAKNWTLIDDLKQANKTLFTVIRSGEGWGERGRKSSFSADNLIASAMASLPNVEAVEAE